MTTTNSGLKEIAEVLKKAKSVAIVSHVNPDGDSFASMFALGAALKSFGVSVSIRSDQGLSKKLGFLNKFTDFEINEELPNTDIYIVLDTSYLDRVQFSDQILEFRKSGKKIITIDHHRGGNQETFSDYYYIDEEAAANSEIIFDLINILKVPIDKNIATCLLTGIETDTSSFTNLNTTEKTLRIASVLVAKGARLGMIVESSFNEKSVNQLHFWGRAMERIIFSPKYKAAITYLLNEDSVECGLDLEATSGVANFLNKTKDTSILFVMSEESPGVLKVSLRTKSKLINLSKFAGKLNGGGHPGAASFSLSGRIDDHNGEVKII